MTGIYDDKAGLLADLTRPERAAAARLQRSRATRSCWSSVDPRRRRGRRHASAPIRAIKAQFPSVKALTKQGFIDQQKKQINQLLVFFYVLLALTVVISLFGIVNTLVLAIHERTRELGMLRAIGTSRRQVRQIVRYESVITALIGATLGVVLGAIFAVLVTIPLKSEGFVISIPVAAAGRPARARGPRRRARGDLPARRAAKLDVLEALGLRVIAGDTSRLTSKALSRNAAPK